ncbi:MAG: DUF4384 domain-containing protein [Gemmatimonadota bacterium]
MRIHSALLAGTLALASGTPEVVWAQRAPSAGAGDSMETRIWLDRGLDPVFQAGDRARVYYRASRDAYVALFHLDTDGVLRLLYPDVLAEPQRVRGGQDYRLLFPQSSDWQIEEAPGVGYFFALASETPFAFGDQNLSSRPAEWAVLAASGAPVREDPFVLLDAVARDLVPDPTRANLAVDLTVYHVGQAFSFPRFLCYNCHTAEPFEAWNPYQQACLDYRVVIFNDPYFYPASRYQGNRSVYPRPPNPGQPQFAFRERAQGESGAPLVQARVRATGGAGSTSVRGVLPMPSGATPASGAGVPPVTGPLGDSAGSTQGRPVLQRRTSEPGSAPQQR